MGFFSILGRVAVDTKPAEQGLDKFEHKANSFADRVEHKVGKKLDKAFGVGLVAGLVVGKVHEFFDTFLKAVPERSKEISELGKKMGLGAESVQALELAAKEAEMPVEEFIKTISESGQVDATIERIRALRKEVTLTQEDIENAKSSGATWDWWKKLLMKTSAGLHQAMINIEAEAMGGYFFRPRAFTAELAEEKRQQELNREVQRDIDEAKLKKILSPKPETPATIIGGRGADRFQYTASERMGAYVGTPGDVLSREQAKATLLLKSIDQRLLLANQLATQARAQSSFQ